MLMFAAVGCSGRQIKDLQWFFIIAFFLLFLIAAGKPPLSAPLILQMLAAKWIPSSLWGFPPDRVVSRCRFRGENTSNPEAQHSSILPAISKDPVLLKVQKAGDSDCLQTYTPLQILVFQCCVAVCRPGVDGCVGMAEHRVVGHHVPLHHAPLVEPAGLGHLRLLQRQHPEQQVLWTGQRHLRLPGAILFLLLWVGGGYCFVGWSSPFEATR